MPNSQRYEKPEDRFWSKVHDRDGEGCWEWTASKRKGYGFFQINHKVVTAHRYSWELHNGPIPNGLHVCHHCDNPACVRPDHLFVGTDKDNAIDKTAKGRNGLIGSRLTAGKAQLMRAMWDSGEYIHRELCEIFDVTESTTNHVVHRKTWRHV